MEAVTAIKEQAVRQMSVQREYSRSGSADLTLRTMEGDIVSLQFKNHFSFFEGLESTRVADGGEMSDLSVTAQAASDYSIKVQGDLNPQEMAAIQSLAQGIMPHAQSFFENTEFAPDELTNVLKSALGGDFNAIDLNLESTETKKAAVAAVVESVPQSVGNNGGGSAEEDIRDVKELVMSVLDAVYKSLEEVAKEKTEKSLPYPQLKDLFSGKVFDLLKAATEKTETKPEAQEAAQPAAGEQKAPEAPVLVTA